MVTAVSADSLVSVSNLSVEYRLGRFGQRGRSRSVLAVDDVSFEIRTGETLGLVGESGSGKTTVSRALTGLVSPTRGSILFAGKPILGRMDRDTRRSIQMVFQDPYSSLDPRMRVGRIIGEPLRVNSKETPKSGEAVASLLAMVGLPEEYSRRYPHQLSGGQRQRVGIARALALSPRFVVCDEPVSALDVSVQAQILNLLADLQERLNLTYLFVSHDLAVVDYLAHNVAVMHLGRIVEIGARSSVLRAPTHPYTIELLNAARSAVVARKRRRRLPVVASDATPGGCEFRIRCVRYQALGEPEVCRTVRPELGEVSSASRAACHFPEMSAGEMSTDFGKLR